jgi:hypothetical protein
MAPKPPLKPGLAAKLSSNNPFAAKPSTVTTLQLAANKGASNAPAPMIETVKYSEVARYQTPSTPGGDAKRRRLEEEKEVEREMEKVREEKAIGSDDDDAVDERDSEHTVVAAADKIQRKGNLWKWCAPPSPSISLHLPPSSHSSVGSSVRV